MISDAVPHVIAHRGWSAAFPENTFPAFAAAIAAGTDEIEFDVRLTRDEVAIVCHDVTADRVSNLAGPISSLDAAELSRASMLMPDGSLAEGLGFTSVATIIEWFVGKVGMNIHVKTTEETDAVLEAIADVRLESRTHDVYIAGSPAALERAAAIRPSLARCCLDSSKNADEMLDAAMALGCKRVQFRRNSYEPTHVERAIRHGIVPNLYYADDLQEAEQAVRGGIFGLLTNNVGPVIRHLAAVGIRSDRVGFAD